MIAEIQPGMRRGAVLIPSSKSMAHRLLICAALSREESRIECRGISQDIRATVTCLNALGANITELSPGILSVRPLGRYPEGTIHLYCGESGSTLRFLLPLSGTVGADAVFHPEGRLAERPLSPLTVALQAHGMHIIREGGLLYASGKLHSGDYYLPGNVSSQFISGLLMALPLLDGISHLTVVGNVESADYIRMTESVLLQNGIRLEKLAQSYWIPGGQRSSMRDTAVVEGDWSNAAFFLCMGALSDVGVIVRGLDCQSIQGDRRILDCLETLGAIVERRNGSIYVRRGELNGTYIDASQIPDLIPVLSIMAAGAAGTTHITHAGRLRFKESDRLQTVTALLKALGADIREESDGLVIRGKPSLIGGTVDSCGDHRIAMAAAVAAGLCLCPVRINGAECIAKSYPDFLRDLEKTEVL